MTVSGIADWLTRKRYLKWQKKPLKGPGFYTPMDLWPQEKRKEENNG